jgi:hypothetical protein
MSKAYIDICSSAENPQLNTGFKDNCIESKLLIPVISNGHEFADIADFRTVASWRTAISEKKLVPLFPVYELADASTEDTLFESGNFSRVTQKGTEIITFECYISIAAYAALKSYEELGSYGELFEFNEEGDYSGVFASDGVKVKGRKITSMEVTRIRATKDKVPYVTGRIVFADKDDVLSTVLVKSDLEEGHLEGIYDVDLEQVSASSTSIRVTAKNGNTLITNLEDGDLVVKDAGGAVQSTTFVAPGQDGVYELTGTGFATGYTVELNGVVVKTTIMYEEAEPLTITVT